MNALRPMVDYTLQIRADSGYEWTTTGRCTAEQYGHAIGALHGKLAGAPTLEQRAALAKQPHAEAVREDWD